MAQTSTEMSTEEEAVVHCARHPNVETELRCGRCETPICPRCLVQTPVGARCRDCAGLRRLPTFQVSIRHLVLGMGAAVAAGAATGVLWAVMLPERMGFLAFFFGIALGYAIGEAVSVATNRRRAPPLQAIAVVGVILAYVVRNLVEGMAVIPTDDLYGYLMAGMAAVVAIGRLR